MNGKRNGKGKEYDYYNNTLEFEGEYLNNERWNGFGKIREGWYDRRLKEYEYKNGKIWNMKEYDKNNNILNELIDGKGFIKEYELGKLKYEGEYLNGKRNGKWKEYDNGKLKNEREYLNGKNMEKEKYMIEMVY